MALGSGESPSTSGTSGSSSATSTHSATSNGGFFTANNSPPLILAFLAVALFTGAMVAVFGWRRMRVGSLGYTAGSGRGRMMIYDDVGGFGSGAQMDGVGERPILFDLRTENRQEKSGCGSLGESGWDEIMPLSAGSISDEKTSNTASPTSPNSPTTFRSLHDIRHYRQRQKMETQTEKDIPRLQIAMPITMPSARRHFHENGTDGDHEERLEYCIGLVDVPWQKEDNEAG